MKTRQILITILFLTSTFFIKAQDKFEFMVIFYSTDDRQLSVSIDGKEFSREKVELPKEQRGADNVNPLLKKVSEYQDKNWEVMDFKVTSTNLGSSSIQMEHYYAFLRKKKLDKK